MDNSKHVVLSNTATRFLEQFSDDIQYKFIRDDGKLGVKMVTPEAAAQVCKYCALGHLPLPLVYEGRSPDNIIVFSGVDVIPMGWGKKLLIVGSLIVMAALIGAYVFASGYC